MNDQIKELAGLVIAAVLALDGLLHAYWATGQIWPARNKLTLVQAVLNRSNTRAFRSKLFYTPVCLVLFIAAVVVASS